VVGVTGSLILLSLWIFLVSQFGLFGAEFSKTYTITMGSQAKKTSTPPVADRSEGEKNREQVQEKKEKRDEIEKTQKEYSSPFQVDVTVKFKRKEDK